MSTELVPCPRCAERKGNVRPKYCWLCWAFHTREADGWTVLYGNNRVPAALAVEWSFLPDVHQGPAQSNLRIMNLRSNWTLDEWQGEVIDEH